MKCEWCGKREAKHWGKPSNGPESRMCDECQARICAKDETGAFVSMPIEQYQQQVATEKH